MLKKEGSPIFGMVMLRRSKVQAAGPFDQRLRNLADVDMWYRLLLKNKFVFLDEALIQIAPREVDHVIKPSNWKIQIQYELIYIVNALRRNPDSFGLFSRLDIDLMLLRRSVRWICWCVLKKQITGIKDGLRHIAGYLHRKREILLDSGRVHGSWEEIESLSRKV